MKRIILILGIGLLSCNNTAGIQDDYLPPGVLSGIIDSKGMHYIIIKNNQGGIRVINTTKDSLECELLRRQLK